MSELTDILNSIVSFDNPQAVVVYPMYSNSGCVLYVFMQDADVTNDLQEQRIKNLCQQPIPEEDILI